MSSSAARRWAWIVLIWGSAALAQEPEAQSSNNPAASMQIQLGTFESSVLDLSAATVERKTERALIDLSERSGSGLAYVRKGGGQADVLIDAKVVRIESRYRIEYQLRTTREPVWRQPIVFDLKKPEIGQGGALVMAERLVKVARDLESRREQAAHNEVEPVQPVVTVRAGDAGTVPDAGAAAEVVLPVAEAPQSPEALGIELKPSGFVDAYFSQLYEPAPGKIPGAREVAGEVRLRARASDLAAGVVAINARFDPTSPWRTRVALWEANAQLFLGPVELTLGRQFVSWGGPLSLADKINGRDLSDQLRPERVPIFALRVVATAGDFRFEAVGVPEVAQTIRPEVSDLAASSEDENLSRNPWHPNQPTLTASGAPQRLHYRLLPPPPVRAENIGLGLRVLYQGPVVTAGLSYFRGWDPLPIRLQTRGPDPLNPTAGAVLAETVMQNQRMQIFAAEVSATAFGVQLFVGAGFFRTASFAEADPRLSVVTEPSFSAIAGGIEVRLPKLTSWLGLRFTAQWRGESQVFLTDGNLLLDPRPPKATGQNGIVVLRHPMANGPDGLLDLTLFRRFHLIAAALWDVGDAGRYLTVSGGFEPIAGVRLTVGTDFVDGPPTSFWGARGFNDRFFARVRYEFGR